jgi:urea carboxylase-associated protein 2
MSIASQSNPTDTGLSAIDPGELLFEEVVPGGRTWSHVVKRGTALRLTDLEGRANVSWLAYNAAFPVERYNMADTLKAQHTSKLTRGHVLYSDMGRILFSITGDSHGWHDTMCGCSNEAMVLRRYGEGSFGSKGNAFHLSGRDAFLTELAKWGLGKRDLVANVNFFSKVAARSTETGAIAFDNTCRRAGGEVELRAEMNALTVINTCPHPLDPAPEYSPGPVLIQIRRCPLAGPDDFCRNFRPENERGFVNTERYFL